MKPLAGANRASFMIKSAVDTGTPVEIAFPETRVAAEWRQACINAPRRRYRASVTVDREVLHFGGGAGRHERDGAGERQHDAAERQGHAAS
jgi:hypothetical protein